MSASSHLLFCAFALAVRRQATHVWAMPGQILELRSRVTGWQTLVLLHAAAAGIDV
jgi:hypothetical protein